MDQTIVPWVKGKNRRWAILSCCPNCGEFVTAVIGTVNKNTRYNRCKSCNISYMEVHAGKRRKGTVVVVA